MSNSPSKVILITGCSSGFGLLTAARLAHAGHHVYATMRNLEKKSAVINEVNRRGGNVETLKLDVTNKKSIKDAVATVASRHGYIDVLVNNAGYGIGGFFEDLTDAEIREQMETNFFGVQNVTREVIPIMRQRREGKIINISSVAGFSASPAFGAYNASKWALEGFSESLRYELQPFGIGVHLVEPGTYRTEIFYGNAKYAKNFENPESPYVDMSHHLRKEVIDYVNNCKKDPEAVAQLIEKLITAKRAPFRNIPDIESRMMYFFRKYLPFNLYSRVIYGTLLYRAKEIQLK